MAGIVTEPLNILRQKSRGQQNKTNGYFKKFNF